MAVEDEPGSVDAAPAVETDEPVEAAEPGGKETDENQEGLVLATEVLPEQIPLIPVRPRPYFPGFPAPLTVQGDRIELVRRIVDSDEKVLGLILVRDPEGDDEPENLHPVGTAARVVRARQSDPDTAHLVVNCLQRFKIEEVWDTPKGMLARVKYHYDPELSVNQDLKAYSMAIISTLKELVKLDPLQSEAIKMFLSRSSMEDPAKLADFSANLTTADGQELQEILETFDVRDRIDKVLVLLRRELDLTKLQKQITQQIEEKISKQQREFFLKEQLKAIKKELGLEKEGKTAEIERFEKRLEELKLEGEAKQAIEEELEKFRVLEPVSPEYTVTRNYLEWLTVLPWGRYSRDSFGLKRARRILDRDHYGLEDVKDRIVEFIAVGKMKGDIAGSIMCLVGPPGVGKTSIGRSVAEALNRRFYRFSLGGMRDEAEIKGHRRTYIGAMPGKFIQALKTVGTANPVIMLDEIDKVGMSFRGDPASALLEVLDPEQNSAFRDHYLDVPFDLSSVLFIATANQLDTIPGPLMDRMEVIRLSGYITREKVEIARRHLVPKNLQRHGLEKGQVIIRKPALERLVNDYAREAGVRGLENLIRKILRKAAVELADGEKDRIQVGVRNVVEYLGQPTFKTEVLAEDAPGVVNGLAWTSHGGAALQVEATAVLSKRRGFKQTGQLGAVMVESSEIAYSYVMAHLEEYGAPVDFFDRHFIHLHVPAGATPKDGPSAGVTMATALVSMVLKQPVRAGLAMTGELTLTGRVLAVGGIKEKIIAARRAGCSRILLPQPNHSDVAELPGYLKEGLDIRLAERFDDVYREAFPS